MPVNSPPGGFVDTLQQYRHDGLTFDLDDSGGDGDVVVLLHGFPETKASWRRVTPHLVDAGYRVVAPDQRGYSPGARPADTSSYAMAHLVSDVVGMLDALGADRADVVGHDWGAAVAWQVAGHHPERVSTLTAVSVPHPLAFLEALRTDDDQRERSQYMRFFEQEGVAEDTLLADDAAALRAVFGPVQDVDRYVEHLQRPGALTAALSWYRAQDLATVQASGPTTVPTLYVWSDGDVALGPVAAHATAAHVSAPYRFEVLHDVSHWVPDEAPEQLSGWVLEHLATHA
jgi:pimeloyl-ACP methyl ester carboxylesterase